MTHYLTDQEYETALNKYKGAFVQLWLFSVSRKRLAVRFSFPGKEDDLFVIVVGCSHISGPFSWENAEVGLVSEGRPDNETITGLTDRGANFEIKCDGGVAMVVSSEPGIWKSFHDYSSL